MALFDMLRREGNRQPEWMSSHPFADLHREMDRMLSTFFRPEAGATTPWFEGGYPRVDVGENAETFKVTAELPGVKVDDVKVTLAENLLTISGSKSEEKEEEGRDWTRKERLAGTFRRTIPLSGNVDPKKVEATFKDGVLTVVIARHPEDAKAPRAIAVKKG